MYFLLLSDVGQNWKRDTVLPEKVWETWLIHAPNYRRNRFVKHFIILHFFCIYQLLFHLQHPSILFHRTRTSTAILEPTGYYALAISLELRLNERREIGEDFEKKKKIEFF